jgi:AcrR family transcriptional regulator
VAALPNPHPDSPDPPCSTEARRGARARQAILEAADDLLVEEGFAAVTIEGIAARAGVAKQTIYRWWPSKVEVLMDSLLDDAVEELEEIDSGSAAEDARLHLSSLTHFLTGGPAGRVLAALIGQAQHDPHVADELRRRYLGPRRAHDRQLLIRAIERGELSPDADLDATLDALEGPIYFRALVAGVIPDQRFIDAVVERVFPQPSLRGESAAAPSLPV